MGLYTNFDKDRADFEVETANVNMDELLEAFYYDDHYSDSDYEKQQLLETPDPLLEAKKISRRTIVKLNKNDDLTRRTGMAALQLAKDNNDVLWQKLVKNRIMERKLLAAIKKKYANKAKVVATKGQRAYVSGNTNPTGNQNVKKMNPKEMANTRK
jgi:hypothetical protein